MAEFNTKVTPEIERLTQECKDHSSIDLSLYGKYDVKRGLRDINGKGVLAGLTQVSNVQAVKVVDGKEVPCAGSLYYRGYNIKDLTAGFVRDNRFGFEETTYLLLYGKLPDRKELEDFQKLLANQRSLPTNFVRDVIMKAPGRDIMNALSRSVLTLYSYDNNPDDISLPNVMRQCLNLISVFPLLSVYGYQAYNHYVRGKSLYIHNPKKELSTAENILRMLRPDKKYTDLEASSAEDAVALKEKITDKLHNFIIAENYEAIFSISIGVIDAATFCEGTEECRKKFEFALKQAKGMGKNGFYVFDQDDYEAFLQKGRIVAALRNAIVNNYEGFEVNYQPIVDCQTEQIIGAEALMRFSMITEEGREFVSPMEFIPLLEETGLIIPAGRYILNEAAVMCCEMQKYIPDFRMNVNVSYVQILQGNVERDILDAIQKYSLQPECLCVEMTESGFMDMTPSFCKFRKTLDKNRIPFVIDDFGTGYSNLHCIRDMNPSYVKMDRDFTAKAMNSARDYELYKNIIPMVHSINVRICAEGIEEREWLLKMKAMKVDYLQGYYFGRPCGKKQFLQQYARGINVK